MGPVLLPFVSFVFVAHLCTPKALWGFAVCLNLSSTSFYDLLLVFLLGMQLFSILRCSA
jgi:hypothetical protein